MHTQKIYIAFSAEATLGDAVKKMSRLNYKAHKQGGKGRKASEKQGYGNEFKTSAEDGKRHHHGIDKAKSLDVH